MPDISSVDQAVEKLAQEALTEKPGAAAPAEAAPAKAREESAAPKETTGEAAEMTAFEQELITEFKEEYESAGDKPAFLNALKRSYRKQAKQMTELGTLRKAVGALKEAGVTNEDLMELIGRKRTGGNGRTEPAKTTEAANERGYARWMTKTTDPAEREQLREAEQVVRELVEDLVSVRIEEIRDKEVKPLRDRMEYQDRQTLTKRAQQLDQEINDLEDKQGYPGSLVETHREAMRQLGLREPDLSVEDLLVRTAGFAAVKTAMLKRAKGSEAEPETERGTKPPASVVRKPGPQDVPRNSRGVASITRALDLLVKPKR